MVKVVVDGLRGPGLHTWGRAGVCCLYPVMA